VVSGGRGQLPEVAGLLLLAEQHHRCADLGSPLLVVANSRPVIRPIEITGFNELLTIVPTIHETQTTTT
jgi:anti-anti-sigma factor